MSIALDGSNGITQNSGYLTSNVYTVSSLPTAGTAGFRKLPLVFSFRKKSKFGSAPPICEHD